MNELERYNQTLQRELDNEQAKRQNLETSYNKMSAFSPVNEQSLVQFQLDLEKEKDRMYHLLSGHVFKNVDGNGVWVEPDDDREKIFSSYGVNNIMNLISFYLSPNTLLSCYKEEQINWTVKDFGNELNDLIFARNEAFFHYPTPEQLFEKYWPIVQDKTLYTEQEFYNVCLEWSLQELKNKNKHAPSIIFAVIHSVHATYLRALNGEERETLRKFIHVSQSTSTTAQTPVQKQGWALFKK